MFKLDIGLMLWGKLLGRGSWLSVEVRHLDCTIVNRERSTLLGGCTFFKRSIECSWVETGVNACV